MYCCKAIHCGNTVTVTDTAVEISFADGATGVADTQPFNFRLCQSIPADGAALPVTLNVNGASVPLWNRYGNPVIGSQLKSRVNYCGFYGATTPHVISWTLPLPVRGCVC
jgi:hypothetical protein